MNDVLNKIYNYALEEIMEKRYGDYAKEIIQDRALPDVRDGLKPVQRRILYAMFRDRNTYDKPHKKAATAVGNVMGHYHPHGDSSIYEALVRMSQWWKTNTPYIDMHGNNGSMDGDSAAAMRYTEARLSKISNELLKDIDKNTVEMAWNFDDTLKEPTVLPAKYPNLLVNGANGISAGYATNIPTHNLGEVIDATIKRIDSPNSRLDTILEIVKGPDFPTGAIVEGKKGLIDAYTTGIGKINIRSKYEFIKEKGKEQIVIHEIPFEVNKANLVAKIAEIKFDKKIDGITDVRDESDKDEPMRIVIDLKKGADKDLIINYLLKNTDLQVNYSFNMVAIVNKKPMTIGILPMLDAYIAHQKEVILRRTHFDLETAKREMHIVEGLIKALSILDEVIATIRRSKNKSDAKDNLVKEYKFTEVQAEAIVMLQLYKLTNTDVTELEERNKTLALIIKGLEAILNDEEKLKGVMKEELRRVKKDYGTPRKTEIRDEITEVKIDTVKMIPKEDAIITVTKEGYVKRVSLRSYDESVETGLKEGDYIIGKYKMSTLDTLILFTDLGNYLYIPVHELPDLKWKEMGKHISNIISIKPEENIIYSMPVYDFEENKIITMFTRDGMIKRTSLVDFKALRYTKPIVAIKLKGEDKLVSVSDSNDPYIFISTNNGYGLSYNADEVPVTGLKASGVKSISLKNDVVVSGHLYNDDYEYLTVVTRKNTAKRVRLSEFEKSTRARRGVQIIKEVKTNPYYVLNTFIIDYKKQIGLKTGTELNEIKLTEIPISDRHKTGSSISKLDILETYEVKELVTQSEKKKVEKENLSLDDVDKRILTIDDFLDEVEKS
ncbi:MAG: DNA topoisomerase IV subunit A [Lactobacillales bacterium]|nr:DNA topoisomerase IV subunit A [Lactobacillales bacterium]